jgi:hypothetical protein
MRNTINNWVHSVSKTTWEEDLEPVLGFFWLVALVIGAISLLQLGIVAFNVDIECSPTIGFIIAGLIYLVANFFHIGEVLAHHITKFVTRGDYVYNNDISFMLFGEVVAGRNQSGKSLHEYPDHNRYALQNFGRHIFYNILAAISAIAVVTFMAIPWIAITVTTVVGTIVGVLLTARKAFDVSRKLTQHVNNKDIHNTGE